MNREPLVLPRSEDSDREAVVRIFEWDPKYLDALRKALDAETTGPSEDGDDEHGSGFCEEEEDCLYCQMARSLDALEERHQ